jgi:hypothetical protein
MDTGNKSEFVGIFLRYTAMNPSVGKYIVLAGAILILVGLLVWLFGDKLGWLGRLPGDIRMTGQNGGGFYFPIVTCIVVSIVLNIVIALVRRFF